MQSNNEAELIARSLNGDSEAYAELVDRYKNAVYYHCFAIVRDEDVAEDITQETFINAYYKLKQYNQKYRLATWLFKISTNKSLNHLKKQRHQTPLDDVLAQRLTSRLPSPQKQATEAELHHAMRKLRPKYQAVISLYYWQDLDYAATAKALDVPVNTVRTWLKRAKDELRKEIL